MLYVRVEVEVEGEGGAHSTSTADQSVLEVELDIGLLVLEPPLQAVYLVDELPVDRTRPPTAQLPVSSLLDLQPTHARFLLSGLSVCGIIIVVVGDGAAAIVIGVARRVVEATTGRCWRRLPGNV